MMMAIGWMWAFVGASMVAWLLARQERKELAAVDRGEEVDLSRTVSPGAGFVICGLFLITAPFVLGRARGWRGALEGLAILVGACVLNVATFVLLAVLRGQ